MDIQAIPRLNKESSRHTKLVDCDVHVAPVAADSIAAYLPQRWRHHNARFYRTYQGDFYPRRSEYGERFDAWPPSGLRPGADLDFLRKQHLDAWGIDIAVITPITHPSNQANLEFSAALARAMNEWQLEVWLEREPRLRGSILVPTEDPEAAATEIERWAHDHRFVQIYLYAGTLEPIGRRRYWKLFEAAESNRLPVAMHFGAAGPHAPTGAGFPSFYLEDHAGASTMFQDQVTSLAFEGVFVAFPNLDFVLIEGGFAWLAPLMWRLDAAWRKLGGEVPHVDRPPSELLREHLWYTTQPMEEPPNPQHFSAILEQLGGDERLMFASDYPHWDFDAPDSALPTSVTPESRRRIMGANACRLYGLELCTDSKGNG
ncbi:MAG TPA: amidohydrolase family protein [Candidatus Dormibacteraeota bacterium]|nr:amidohydrolase family protein [Candidatus Dormibacteraeota bacterium]